MSILDDLEGYYKRFDPNDNYEKMLFRAGRGLQSAELNDLQEQVSYQMQNVSSTILTDGDVLRGGDVVIDNQTGITRIGKSSVYLRGYVRELDQQTITIPITVDPFYIGVWLSETVITELEAPDLRDPATEARNYREPGAARLQIGLQWGLKEPLRSGTFYPVYRVENGALVTTQPPAQMDSITTALARFDRESTGGNYVVDGLEITGFDYQEDHQVISFTEGNAHIEGYGLRFPVAFRKPFPVDPDLRTVVSEGHGYQPGAEGKMRIDTHEKPINDIIEVRVVREKTVPIVRGADPEGEDYDNLPDSSISDIVAIGSYVYGTHYVKSGNRVTWLLDDSGDLNPGDSKPTLGSTYSVTYRYWVEAQPQEVDDLGFTIGGDIVPGSQIIVTYQWKMPRIDCFTLDKEGIVRRIKGIPHPTKPRDPRIPLGQLTIGKIKQTWYDEVGIRRIDKITNNSIRAVSMAELRNMQQQIGELYDLVAIEQLRNNANAQDPAAKKGVFVDPFFDDDMRDAGAVQSAAVIAGQLMLPIEAEVIDLANTQQSYTLEFVHENILKQPMHTGEMKVNPYQAYDPIPPGVTLIPQVDRWTETEETWSSPITKRFQVGGGARVEQITTNTVEVISSKSTEAEYLRQREVEFRITDFGPGETLAEILFDGVSITTFTNTPGGAPVALAADNQGMLNGFFTIPAQIRSGTKFVQFKGGTQSITRSTYTGHGEISIDNLRRVTNITTRWFDPLAQTFTLSESRLLTGVDIWFTKKGTSDVRLQIRETDTGLPNQTVLAEVVKKSADIILYDVNGTDKPATSFRFDPVFIDAGVEYAVVILTDDPDYEVCIAELGKFDKKEGWIARQPYQIGILLSSSNAQTWTPHQEMDLNFCLWAAQFTNTYRIVPLGTVNAADVSDLLPLASVERTSSETDISFMVKDKTDTKKVYQVQDNQVINLAERIQGDVEVEAHLRGSEKFSPVLFPGVQLGKGKIRNTADYVTRAIACGSESTLKIVMEEFVENDASVAVYWEDGTGTWNQITTANPPLGVAVGNGWREKTYTKTGLNQDYIRIKLVLNGSAADRPLVRSLRVLTT